MKRNCSIRSERVAEFNTKLAAYTSLADHFRYRAGEANRDQLLKHSLLGREQAYADLMLATLREQQKMSGPEGIHHTIYNRFGKHMFKIKDLEQEFAKMQPALKNANNVFSDAERVLLALLEEMEAIAVLSNENDPHQYLVSEVIAHLKKAICPESAISTHWSADDDRTYRLDQANEAFAKTHPIMSDLHNLGREFNILAKKPKKI